MESYALRARSATIPPRESETTPSAPDRRACSCTALSTAEGSASVLVQFTDRGEQPKPEDRAGGQMPTGAPLERRQIWGCEPRLGHLRAHPGHERRNPLVRAGVEQRVVDRGTFGAHGQTVAPG